MAIERWRVKKYTPKTEKYIKKALDKCEEEEYNSVNEKNGSATRGGERMKNGNCEEMVSKHIKRNN